MLNFAINYEESKKFVKFYKEKDDSLIVYYGNLSREEIRNTSSNKDALNAVMEEQILSGDKYFTDDSSKFRIDSRYFLGRLCFTYSCFTTMAGVISIPISSLLNVSNDFGVIAFSITGGLLILPIKNIIKAIDLSKNRLFVDNKDAVTQYLIENDSKPLTINDVHNLNICSVALTTMKANSYNKRNILRKERKMLLSNEESKPKALSKNTRGI